MPLRPRNAFLSRSHHLQHDRVRSSINTDNLFASRHSIYPASSPSLLHHAPSPATVDSPVVTKDHEPLITTHYPHEKPFNVHHHHHYHHHHLHHHDSFFPMSFASATSSSIWQKRQFWSFVNKAQEADEVQLMRRKSKEEHESRLSSLSTETKELLASLKSIDLTEVISNSDDNNNQHQHQHHPNYYQPESQSQSQSQPSHRPPLSELAPHAFLPMLASPSSISSQQTPLSSSSLSQVTKGNWVAQGKPFLSSVSHPCRAHTAIERVAEYVESLLIVRGEDDAEAFAVMGDVFHRCGMYSQGIVAYRRAIACQPSAALHLSLADCYKHVGRLEMAARSTEEALRLNPDDGEVHYQRAMILQAMGKRKKALNSYQHAMSAGHRQPSLLMNYCVLAFQCGHDALAFDIGRQALSEWPEHSDLYETLVSMYYISGRIQDAIRLGEDAIRRFPHSARHYHCLGDIYARESMWEECRDCMECARSNGVSDRFILMHLSLAYAQLGYDRQARDIFQLAKRAASDGWQEDEYLAKLEKHLTKHHKEYHNV